MKIADLTDTERSFLDQILHFLAAYNLDVVKEPEKLKVEKAANFDFERLKTYCQEIGITLRIFTPKKAQENFVYFQPWPTKDHRQSFNVDEELFSEYFRAKGKYRGAS